MNINSKKVIITAGSEYGEFVCEFAIEDGILCLTRMDGDGNLAGNSLILEFEQEHVDNIYDLRKKLINEVRHRAERCGCHRCQYDVRIEFV